jgi:TrmH family RNA methyltransferase
VLVEGVRAVAEAMASGAAPVFAVVAPRLAASRAGSELRRRLASFECVEVDDRTLAELADTRTPQGVLAVFAEPAPSEAALTAESRVVVIDAVQDPGNLGTLIRSAAAFGFDRVVCLDGTVDPWSPKVVRGSAGTVFQVPLVTSSAADFLDELQSARLPLWVASAEGRPMGSQAPGSGVALAIGNEGTGIRASLRGAASEVVRVPMRGDVESLNAAVAGSILMFALSERND